MTTRAPKDAPIAERIVEHLTPTLGPFTAKQAVSVACGKAGVEASAMTTADLGAIADALRPMLRTLLGARAATELLQGLDEA